MEAVHDLSTAHLIACTPCREAYFEASDAFERSNQPGGEIHRKMEELRHAVDALEARRAEETPR